METEDFKTNGAVARALGCDIRPLEEYSPGFRENYPDTVWVRHPLHDHWQQWCPCNSVDDAWPIIIKNRIGLHPNEDGSYKAFTMIEDTDNYATETDHENPLRAAMLEYLKIAE